MNKISNLCCVLFVLFFIGAANSQDSTTTGAKDTTKTNATTEEGQMEPGAAVLYNAGNELQKSGNPEGAVIKYDSALALAKDYRIYYQMGIALRKLGRLDSSKTAFENAIVAKSDFEGSYNALASVYFAKGDMEKAIENFNKVIELSDDTTMENSVKKAIALAYFRIGAAAIGKKKYQDAVTSLQKAIEYNNLDQAYLKLAQAYSELKKNDETIAASENAIKYAASINKAGPYYYMGIAYKNKGDKVKAKEMFTLAKADATYKKAAEYELTQLK